MKWDAAYVRALRARATSGDADALCALGCHSRDGMVDGLSEDLA